MWSTRTSAELNVSEATCVAAGLLVSNDWFITKIGKNCVIWYDYKHTNQYSIRFDLPDSIEKSRHFFENILSNNSEEVYNYLIGNEKASTKSTTTKNNKKKKQPRYLASSPPKPARLTSTSNFGVKILENGSGGIYSVLTDETKLYVPSSYVDEDKLSEDLLRKALPVFFKFKQKYLSQNEPINVLLYSGKAGFKHSLDTFHISVNVDKVRADGLTRSKGLLKSAVDSTEEGSSNIRVYISRANFRDVDKSYLNNIAVHINIREIE